PARDAPRSPRGDGAPHRTPARAVAPSATPEARARAARPRAWRHHRRRSHTADAHAAPPPALPRDPVPAARGRASPAPRRRGRRPRHSSRAPPRPLTLLRMSLLALVASFGLAIALAALTVRVLHKRRTRRPRFAPDPDAL